MNQIPFPVRREIEDLRRTKIIVRDCQNVTRRSIRILPLIKRKILDLMGSFDAPNCAKKVPASLKVNHRGIFNGVTRIVASLRRGKDGCAKRPMKFPGVKPIGSMPIQQARNHQQQHQSRHQPNIERKLAPENYWLHRQER